jgi:hypothetical protein
MTSDDARYPDLTEVSGEPLKNTALVEAMRNVSVDDNPGTRGLLFQLLLESQLVVLTPARSESFGPRTMEAGETLSLVTLADDDGTVLPVFTSADAVLRWRAEETGVVALPSRALFEMATSNGTNKIALDPGSPTNGVLTRYEIEQLARGRLPLGDAGDVVAEHTEVRIGRPAVPPASETLEALRHEMRARPFVEEAWYFLMQQGDLAPEMCIAVQFASASGREELGPAMREIIDGAARYSEEVKHLSFIEADASWRTSLSSGSGEAFFNRNRPA